MRARMTFVVWFITCLLAGCLHAPKHATAPEPWPLTMKVQVWMKVILLQFASK